jgi:hypothetical protein
MRGLLMTTIPFLKPFGVTEKIFLDCSSYSFLLCLLALTQQNYEFYSNSNLFACR